MTTAAWFPRTRQTTAATVIVAVVLCIGVLTALPLGVRYTAQIAASAKFVLSPVTRDGIASASPTAITLRLPRKKVFLFIGALSAAENWQRRDGCRAAWSDGAQGDEVVTRFFIKSSKVDDAKAAKKIRENLSHDIVPVEAEYDYMTIGVAVLATFKHAVENYDFSFMLKTDDDTFVNVPALLATLRQSCEHIDCKKERLYMGSEIEGNTVNWEGSQSARDTAHPEYRHDELWNRTHAAQYPRYMAGGGYVVSDDVLHALFGILELAGTEVVDRGPEDAAMAYYFDLLKLRHIHSKAFWTRYPEGDYGAPKGFPTRDEQTPAIVCGDDAKIVIHNVKAPDDMRFLGEVAKNCSSAGLA